MILDDISCLKIVSILYQWSQPKGSTVRINLQLTLFKILIVSMVESIVLVSVIDIRTTFFMISTALHSSIVVIPLNIHSYSHSAQFGVSKFSFLNI